MEFLSEDPRYLAGGLGLLAASFFIALRVTQQGKYLVWSLLSLGLMALVLVVEWLWVTDSERIEQAVYDLGRAVAASDAPGVLDRLTPDVQLVVGGSVAPGFTPGEGTREMIRERVAGSKFDVLRITSLRANAGGQSRRGTAEFRVIASGSSEGPFNTLNFGSVNSSWSLGFRETSPGVWKVNRITPVSVPGLPGLAPRPSGALITPPERPRVDRMHRFKGAAGAFIPPPPPAPGSIPPTP